ncbi:MAG: aconitate hydratase AcnA [Pseudomonadota bacterium]
MNRQNQHTVDRLSVGAETFAFYSLERAAQLHAGRFDQLPYSLKVLLENALRHHDGVTVDDSHIEAFAQWLDAGSNQAEMSFYPTRIMMHDVSGIPLLADLAAMREHVESAGRDATRVNPIRPVDFIMDHSVIVDVAGRPDALTLNVTREYERNAERYRVAKWAQSAFQNFRVLPPGKGICHQINLEFLARVIWAEKSVDGEQMLFPDSLVAGDSHTPMVNSLSVMGWGVGAIEALSAMLGEPISMTLPDVVGVRLIGAPREGTTTTDIALALTRRLREHGVVQKFVEFHGPGLDALTLPERATLANMAPEYGASMGFFPTDAETLDFLRLTGRGDHAPVVEAYCKAQGLWRDDTAPRVYSDALTFDLSDVEASVAGPKLPQSQVPLREAHISAQAAISEAAVFDSESGGLTNGDVVIAAITSCTNTSNPRVMVAAGLLAQKAVARGLETKPWVKTSLSPGSRTVGDYLINAGLLEPLEQLGFHVTGYGCMTCCGGSGGLDHAITADIEGKNLQVAAVLSGNRNFEGRIHPLINLAYLGAPPLVVAYALLGSVTRDITTEPLGYDADNCPVHLRDIWPSSREIDAVLHAEMNAALFTRHYSDPTAADAAWLALEVPQTSSYAWETGSTYITRPPFLDSARKPEDAGPIADAAIIAMFGDSVTTDHISPGSRILEGSLAGDYLASAGVPASEFSGFLQRRTNHEVMMRGTFNNPHIRNVMTPEKHGGWTVHQPSGAVMTIFDAHRRYAEAQRPVVVVAGREYGTGSSRDWAARGPHLLGVRAILAESFERIHRSNLVGMGILPLQFEEGMSWRTLDLSGAESVSVELDPAGAQPGELLSVSFRSPNGTSRTVAMRSRLDTAREVEWFQAGGVMPFVLDRLMSEDDVSPVH